MEEHVFGINFLDRDIPGRRVGFNPGRLLLRRSLNARIFPQNEAAELGQAVCIPRTYEYLIVDCADPRPPYHRGKLYLKAVVSFFIPSPPSFFLLFSRKRRRKREKLYIPEERDDRSFEKVLLPSERRGGFMREI